MITKINNENYDKLWESKVIVKIVYKKGITVDHAQIWRLLTAWDKCIIRLTKYTRKITLYTKRVFKKQRKDID